MRARTIGRGAATVLAGSVLLAACGGGDDDSDSAGDADGITVWVVEDIADRVTAIEAIVDAFSQSSGVDVELVSVAENDFDQLVTSSAAAGDLPDVIGATSLAGVQSMAVNELLDTETPASIVDDLGEDTFAQAALELTRDGDAQLAVPSDGWPQLMVYRKDLFDAAGLEPPTTFDAITTAAETLDGDAVAGIAAPTIPGDAFTQQSFEYFALGNGCELVDDEGTVTLDSPECAETFDFYANLVRDYSVAGNQDVDTTRATYFAGQAAMVVWSSFILDELAGLRNDALPTCPECRADPTFLAQNSGVVTAVQGPSGDEPASYGEITSWVLTADAATDPASEFVRYVMSDGYVDWLAVAPEGRIPTRQGTADDPEEYVTAWEGLDAGVDTLAPLGDFYDAETLETVRTSAETIQRWGFEQGQGQLVGATLGELPVAAALNELVSGSGTGEEAAQQAQDAVAEIQQSLE
ncbi:ABC transporter substrate-binding protein [Jiangella alba]|uniref:Carbohydrate ABC transporter substrate-binding protein, CUT1 family n=1 Tax=Jiangella alba TaxID=561176 RepID=A0A1H5PQ40_9ACTN|nr:extracellular solute-binding protein [Jiangella alba]SEF16023.1 carbohydrate ABC transporter substrate-binding protein, CUT1 family [Jiangella alba]